jgi:ribosomal protein S18 acetylase RimI-like enzyme
MQARRIQVNDDDISVEWISRLDGESAEAIVSLVNCAARDGGTLGYLEPLQEEEAARLVLNLQRRIVIGESRVLLGRAGRTPAFLAILTRNSMPTCRHRAELSKGVVDPRFRGRGLVQLGFRAIVEMAEELGIQQLVLDVREGTRAHALWRRYGFTTYGVLDDYARVAGECHRGHFMVQSVASLRARVCRSGVC